MNKEKWKERMAVLKEKLAFLKPWDMDEDPEDDLEIQELHTQPDSAGRPDEGKTDTGRWFRSKKIYLRAVWQCWRYWWQAASISITAVIRLRNT